ncbi:S9 family peptidase [Lysobacter silvisoli]|uniref:S9 family peptidase n=1 Tax=Lysobacter silvisoli TaxID=2293254 RepID=A0A371K6N3_9GAMM|nr:prolyl oligopeptidase family serine peptidase [Lysobacter silvisoli]RDZ29510.1 S9 family peptidase [Lysobacter silvisoli]
MKTPLRPRCVSLALIATLLFAPGAAALAAAPAKSATAESGYRLPPPALQALVDAPRPPALMLSPHRDLAALVRTPALPGIDVVAQPELKLAGLRINPRSYSQSRFSFGTDLWLLDVASGKEMRVQGLPQPLALASLEWSPDQSRIAFNHVDAKTGANELWLVDVGTRSARRLIEQPLNTVVGNGYDWMPDGLHLLVRLRPEDQGAAPVSDGIPTGPATQQTQGGGTVRQIRTFQDMLKNENDARVFAHYLTAQPALVDLRGQVAKLGLPDLYTALSPSPDGKLLLAQRVERPFSYLVPYVYFPRRIEVLAADGKLVHEVAKLPLVDGLPTGNDAVPTGVRYIGWRADAPATLVWAEAQDGGDPAKQVAIRDAVLMQAAPFDKPPVTLAQLGMRVSDLQWGRGDLALISESWWKTRQTKRWRVAPDDVGRAPQLVFEGSYEDRYADPGDPVTEPDASGNQRLRMDGDSVFLIGAGASPEGDRPFLDKLNLADGSKTRLFHSQAPYYEAPRALLDEGGTRLLTTRESPTEPSNYYLRDLGKADAAPTALTRFPHPTPQLKDVKKEQIRYKRADGVELTGTLYLPPKYEPKRDGPLPLLMWAYPQEFKSASAASQVTDSPYRFNAISYWGPQAFLAMGYAVLDDPSMPIVGEGDKEPNDTYLQQLTASAQAAVDEVVRRGVADRERIAIGGHSYGAFMTANLLAHTRLFKAGIARSGAYNRTLTPFGFQAEERNYWQAQSTYETMSPFNFADKIKDPILLIHGEQDNNSGTFPIQSERMYAAIKGLGGNARLVMLPNESHGYRARESILHMLAESNDWLETYVKGAKPAEGKGKAGKAKAAK